jgi:CheY-like chemotaxis protein
MFPFGKAGTGPLTVGKPAPGERIEEQPRLLIVDDDEDVATSLGILLEAQGYAVKIVVDGTEALDHVKQFVPHVILLDIAMPRISGYQLAKDIRREPGFANVSIVAISGYGDTAHKEQSLDAGIDHHLLKPVQFAEFSQLLRDEISRLGKSK